MATGTSQPENDPSQSESDAKLGDLVARVLAWAKGNRRAAGLSIVAFLAVVFGVSSILSLFRPESSSLEEGVTMVAALQELDQRNLGEARSIAIQLRSSDELHSGELGGPIFVLGAVAALEADSMWGKKQWNRYLLAANYLEEARDRGFPEGREAEGVFLRGLSLYRVNQYASCRRVLQKALDLNLNQPERKREILRMLTGVSLDDKDHDIQLALKYNSEYLADVKLSDNERSEGILRQARIQFKLGDIDATRAQLTTLFESGINLAEANVMEGQLLMLEAERLAEQAKAEPATQSQIVAKYQRAMKILGEARKHDNAGNVATRKAYYLRGLCLVQLKKDRKALEQFGSVRKLHADTPEGLVAGLSEADLNRKLGKDEKAIEGYRRVISTVAATQGFSNPWITEDEFRQRMIGTFRDYLDDRKFEHAVQMSTLLGPLVNRVRSVQLSAQARVAWAKSIEAEANELSRSQKQARLKDARKQYRQAGKIYARLARLRIATREYPEDLWNIADNLRLGHDYKSSILVFGEYLKNESRSRQPAALLGLGEAHLVLGQLDAAVDALRRCIDDYPNHPAKYRARILAAEAYIGKGVNSEAEQHLRNNLTSPNLGPNSIEWQESLFRLGHFLHVEGRYKEAILRLEEAVERYPKSPQTMESQYLIAESYRHTAKEPLEMLKSITIETNKPKYMAEFKRLLRKSLEFYEQVQQDLSRRPESVKLTTLEKSILRNCYFARGAVYFDLGIYEEGGYVQALRAYSDATNLYQHDPAVLEAFIQMAACHRRLNRPVEAWGILKRAKVVLGTLDPSLSFSQTTNFTRDEWANLLDQLIALDRQKVAETL